MCVVILSVNLIKIIKQQPLLSVSALFGDVALTGCWPSSLISSLKKKAEMGDKEPPLPNHHDKR